MKTKLQKNYETACMAYIREFEKKHDVYFEFWVADRIDEWAVFGDYQFMFSDIIYDIDTNQPKENIWAWHNDNMMYSNNTINYQSYCKGLRIENIKGMQK